MRRWLLAIVIAAVAIAAAVWLYTADVDVTRIAATLRGHWWAPLAFFAAYVIATLFAIPIQLLSIAAVLVWGWRLGATIELLSATIAAIPPYLLARTAARPAVERRLRDHEHLRELLGREGFTLVLLLRVVAIVPYPLLNYLAGCSTVRLVPYVVATFIGMIPSAFVFAYFVDALAAGIMRPREVLVRAIAAGLLFAAFVLAVRYGARRLRRTL